MGLEGVRLGYRKELEAAGSPEEEEQLFRQLVDRLYEHGKALSIATWFEIDDVIDPADTRRWLSTPALCHLKIARARLASSRYVVTTPVAGGDVSLEDEIRLLNRTHRRR